MNSLEQLLEFISQLREHGIPFSLECQRDALMVTVKSPSTYYEIEFFADCHIEVQTFGPPGLVQSMMLHEILERVIHDVNG